MHSAYLMAHLWSSMEVDTNQRLRRWLFKAKIIIISAGSLHTWFMVLVRWCISSLKANPILFP